MYGLTEKEYQQYILLKQNASRFQQRSTYSFNEAAYRKKWVTTKKNIGTKEKPNLVWWDRKTNSPYDLDKVSSAHIDKEYKSKYNTKTPLADLEYLEAKFNKGRTEAAIEGNLGPLSNLRSKFSTPLEGGGLVIDLKRKTRLAEQEEKLRNLENKASDKVTETEKKPKVFKLVESKQIDYTNLHPDNEHIKVLDKQIEEKKHQMMINLGNKL
tara:strand:- start:8 stop:643 length:636 start_codon:yes stop_codon:yes gene_type:complete